MAWQNPFDRDPARPGWQFRRPPPPPDDFWGTGPGQPLTLVGRPGGAPGSTNPAEQPWGATGNFWDYEGLTFDPNLSDNWRYTQTGAVVRSDFLDVPDYYPEALQDPADFYAAYQGIPEPFRPYYLATLRDATQNNADIEEQRRLAVQGLTQERNRIRGEQEAWRNSPERRATLNAWQERSRPSFSIVSPTEQAAYDRVVAGNYARNLRQSQESAASRGVLSSGSQLGAEAGIRAAADVGGLTIRAATDQANAAARERALGNVGTLQTAQAGLDLQYNTMHAAVTDQLSRMRAGFENQPTDYVAFGQLGVAWDAYQNMLEQLDEDELRFEEATRVGFLDVLNLVAGVALGLPGSGIPEALGFAGRGGEEDDD